MISFRVSKLTDLVVDVSLTSVARGDVLYRGASKWNNLAAGASGSLLMSGGAGADPSWSASLPASIITSGTIAAARLGSGTPDTTTFLRGDSSWQTVTVPTAANPTGTIGINAVNGVASTFMRSDAAPAFNQALARTWTGQQVFETGAAGASPVIFRQTGGTPGTHELQISANGSTTKIESKNGQIDLKANTGGIAATIQYGATTAFRVNYNSACFDNSVPLGWGNGATAATAGIHRSANGVVEINNGTAGVYGALICGQPAVGTVGLTVNQIASATAPLIQAKGISSTSTSREMANIDVAWATPTDASRKARMIFSAWDTAAQECLRIEASGSASMLGFHGSSAIAKPTITGSRGGNAALADLLTQLASYGLITDSTTA